MKMTDLELFNLGMAEYGGRLDLAKRAGMPAGQLYAGIAREAEELIASARQALPRLPQIHFDFVYNRRPNAYAFRVNGQYFIGITSGTFVVLQLLFCRMLADSRLLRHAGDPDSEASDLSPLVGFIPDAQWIRETGLVIHRPKSEARWLYSCYLLTQTALFIIGHEIAHITRGHVDYLNSKTGISVLPEIGWNQPDPMGFVQRQTLEGDADQRSFSSRLGSAQLTAATPDQGTPPWLTAPPTFEDLLFDCCFCMGSFFRLFGDNRFASWNLTAASHPPKPLRRAMLMAAAAQYAQASLAHHLKDVATAALRAGTMSAESAFATIMGETMSGGGLDDALSPEGRAHMNLLADCWFGGLRDRLAHFTYESDLSEHA